MAFSRAVINFVVNTQAARQQILNFKNTINQAGRDLSNTFVGKFGSLVGLGGGVKALKDAYSHVKRLSDFASSFNLPVEQVSKFANTMGLFGASAEDSVQALQSVQQAIIEFRTTGGGALKTVAAQVGLSLFNADGSMKNSMQVIEDLRQKFKGLSASAQVKVAQELGLSNPAILRMLRATDKEYAEMKKQGSEMNIVNQNLADKVQRFNKALEKLRLTWIAIGAVILENVLPYIEKAVEFFNEFNNLSDGTKDIIIKVIGAFFLFKPVVDIFMAIRSAILFVIAPLKLLFGLVIANPILAAIAAIIAVLAVMIIYWDDIKAAVTDFMDTAGKIWDKFVASGTPAAKFLKSMYDQLQLLLTPLKLAGKAFGWMAEKAGELAFKGKQWWDEQKAEIGKGEAVPQALMTREEREAKMQAGLTASNRALSNSINNSVLTNNGDTSNSNVYNTFNLSGTNEELLDKMQRLVNQNATGVVR